MKFKFSGKKELCAAVFLIIAGNFLGIGILAVQRYSAKTDYLKRNSYGEGAYEERLQVETKDRKEEIQLYVEEQKYTEKEKDQYLIQAKQELDKWFQESCGKKGETDVSLSFPKKLEKNPAVLFWSTSQPELLDWEGILGSEIEQGGEAVDLMCTISLEEQTEIWQREVRVYPPRLTEKEKLQKTMWPNTPNDHVLNRAIVAQNAEAIAKLAEIDVPAGTKVLMAEELNGFGLAHPFTGEKLSPVSGIQKAKNFDEAVDKLMKTLDYQGKGHSCGIHTTNDELVAKLAAVVPVTKVVVNQPQCLTNSGGWQCGYPVSMTLGCGTWGGNSVSHNATWKDLLNFTYVSREIPNWRPDPKQLFPAELREKVDK